ncbi:MAG: shikimate kinase [Caldibacillus debilis]|jgi:shikimate kinase|uniref:Shikimate kinase n=1 Tax=Caldibacillus debilis TaxID=301148 RepID=A0A3E0K9K0_9BACI|nr:shikimate kinase [Caldibacillus debilis]MBO2482027.1 shikimate kinase [Bacillaceae bacterium]MBY6271785.1 shikimate kinase [Bacillaceae bacterium]REJ14644.1 MAG: shikimate kinase [Caldibacillus debilis]REJ25240.1 MAG: shikimate kinase [Caldibacillus debilis]REJ31593.1 MAG: shikimate kinase [Caldibacillus debilis]
METIYLIGFMGAGKTTVGKILADLLGYSFYDLDEYIEKTAAQSIPEIFAEKGEAHFRLLEARALRSLPVRRAVVATGGGTAAGRGNLPYMLEKGLVVHLAGDFSRMYARAAGDGRERPLIAAKSREECFRLYQSRLPFYRKAHFSVDTTDRSPAEIARTILERLKERENGKTFPEKAERKDEREYE